MLISLMDRHRYNSRLISSLLTTEQLFIIRATPLRAHLSILSISSISSISSIFAISSNITIISFTLISRKSIQGGHNLNFLQAS